MAFDGVLLIAFGGPSAGGCNRIMADGEVCSGTEHGKPCPEGSPSEAHCFVQGILGKSPARAARVAEVAEHYRAIGGGGYSPFNDLTFRQARQLEKALRKKGLNLPVSAGMRHWGPSIKDVIVRLSEEGKRRLIGIVMAPHQSKVSWEWYLSVVDEAIAALPAERRLEVSVLDPWWKNPGYTGAIADIIREDLKKLPGARARKAEVIFTAHAIPAAIAKNAPYCRQIEETAGLVAKDLGLAKHTIAYQSSASDATMPWTGPDISEAIRTARAAGVQDIVVSPIGFLVDHVEVLYDLDIEARKSATECGIGFIRSGTVGSHPRFIGMLADLVAERR